MLVPVAPLYTGAQLPPPLKVATISAPHPAAASEELALARVALP
jgi:hypothetical protein